MISRLRNKRNWYCLVLIILSAASGVSTREFRLLEVVFDRSSAFNSQKTLSAWIPRVWEVDAFFSSHATTFLTSLGPTRRTKKRNISCVRVSVAIMVATFTSAVLQRLSWHLRRNLNSSSSNKTSPKSFPQCNCPSRQSVELMPKIGYTAGRPQMFMSSRGWCFLNTQNVRFADGCVLPGVGVEGTFVVQLVKRHLRLNLREIF